MEHDPDPPPHAPPADWLEALEESESDMAAGRIVPAEQVHQQLDDSIARIRAKRATEDTKVTAAR